MEGNTIYAVVSTRTPVGSVLCWGVGGDWRHHEGLAVQPLSWMGLWQLPRPPLFAHNLFFFAHLDRFARAGTQAP